jgi:hypothetical protein
MAPVEADIDKSVSAKRNIRIIFLYSDAGEHDRSAHGVDRDGLFRLQGAANRSGERTKAPANAAKLTAALAQYKASPNRFNHIHNHLIFKHYFLVSLFSNRLLQTRLPDSYMQASGTWELSAVLPVSLCEKCHSPTRRGVCILQMPIQR